MKKTLAVGTAILAAAAIAFAGGDVWKTKSMDQWTDKDIIEILTTSPWAKAGVQPQGAATRPAGMTQSTGSTGIAGSKSDIVTLPPQGCPRNERSLGKGGFGSGEQLPIASSGGPPGRSARLPSARRS